MQYGLLLTFYCSLFFGKTKVLARALLPSPQAPLQDGLDKLTPHIHGSIGLLFTPRTSEEVLEYFDTFVRSSYARAGTISPIDFTLPGGVVSYEGGEPLPGSMEVGIRGLGVPTRLNKGKVFLDQDFVVCKEGETLSQNQANLLKMFGKETCEFKIVVRAGWEKESGEVKVYNAAEGSEEMEDDDE